MSTFELIDQIETDLQKLENQLEHNSAGHHDNDHSHGGSAVRVFGADWCPWTRKQKEELTKANIEFEFIDCADESGKELCVGITGFPTVDIGGTQTAGFMDAKAIQAKQHH